MILEFESLKYL